MNQPTHISRRLEYYTLLQMIMFFISNKYHLHVDGKQNAGTHQVGASTYCLHCAEDRKSSCPLRSATGWTWSNYQMSLVEVFKSVQHFFFPVFWFLCSVLFLLKILLKSFCFLHVLFVIGIWDFISAKIVNFVPETYNKYFFHLLKEYFSLFRFAK